MEKRLPLFLLLSAAILFGYQMIFPPPERPAGEGTSGPAGAPLVAGRDGVPTSVPGSVQQAEPWSETFLLGDPQGDSWGCYRATFDSLGGTLSELRLAGYYDAPRLPEELRRDPEHWVALLEPGDLRGRRRGSLLLDTAPSSEAWFPGGLYDVHWAHEVLREGEQVVGVRFTHTPVEGGVTVEKELRLVPGSPHLELVLRLRTGDPASAERDLRFALAPAVRVPHATADRYYVEPKARKGYLKGGEVQIAQQERRDKAGPDARNGVLASGEGFVFTGVDNKYFAVLLRGAPGLPATVFGSTTWRRLYDEAWAAEHPEDAEEGWRHMMVDQELVLRLPPVGGVAEYRFELFAGPKERSLLAEDHDGQEQLVVKDLGFFAGIAGLLLELLGLLQSVTGNWGVAIILLTLGVRGMLFPLNRRSQTAMARHATKMKRVQPKLDEAKERYKNDAQKLRQEQARIMQEEGAFPPLGGCLPVFLQIPVFFGLFSALRVSFDLRQAGFLWVDDLSLPDRLLHLGTDLSLPLVGSVEYLNVLPPLMVVLWIVQQRVMPKPTDEQALRMQKMMMWMPVMFGVFLYNYAAGLSLYMITSSLFGILEYTVVRRIWPLDDKEKPKKAPGKFVQRLMAMQEEAARQQQAQRQGRGPQGGKRR